MFYVNSLIYKCNRLSKHVHEKENNVLTILANNSLIENPFNSMTVLMKQICHFLVLIKLFVSFLLCYRTKDFQLDC